jgi:two-component system sensor histidine kinase/response regulator
MSESDSPSSIELVSDAALVHQLTNNLRSITLMVEELQEKLAGAEGTDVDTESILKQLKRKTEGSLRQLGEYLRHARLSLGEDVQVAPVNVNLAIQEILRDFYNFPQTADVSFNLNLTPDLPDARAIKRSLILAVNNLIDNSLDAIRQKEIAGGVIEIKTHLIGDNVAIDVTDNGVGISSELKEALFDLGFSTKSSGTGMGLWLSKQSIRAWGGDLHLVSTGPEETTFRILLNKWESAITLAGERRVLIVEDEGMLRQALTSSLTERGFEVVSAGTIADAVRLIRSAAYDMALLDIRLDDFNSPSITGLDIARMVREYNPDALIIVFSAFASLDYMREAFRVGIDDYIEKASYSFADLLRRIEVALPRKLQEAAQRRETRRESVRRGQQDRFIYETLSIFSHELRSPLIAVHWNVEALSSGALGEMTEKQTDALESIRSAIKREFLLLDTHLDLSRVERGLEVLNYKPYDLVKVMQEEILAHQEVAKRKQIHIRSLLPEDVAVVRVDINRFRAALNPLMDNAIKFSSEGSEILVSVKLEDGHIEVYISDEGPGIKPEELDRLLGRPTSSDIKLDQRIRASGLGLSLAKRIIEDYHEGNLWFVRKKDGEKGTTVAFRLPVR